MFYGWVIVALAFAAKFLVIGTLIQCYPVFLLPLAEEFGIGRAEASLPTVAVTAAGIVVLPLVGRAVGLYPIRNVMISAAVVGALGLLGISLATSWWMILTLYAVAGSFALGATGLARRPDEIRGRRRTASSRASPGSSATSARGMRSSRAEAGAAQFK